MPAVLDPPPARVAPEPSHAEEPLELPPIVLRLAGIVEMDDEQFFQFCGRHDDLRIERNPNGDILIMYPEGLPCSTGNVRLGRLLGEWADRDGTGTVFGSSAGFKLPNRATRSPDVSWVLNSRLAALSAREWKKFGPLCPDFVLELRSPTDGLRELKEKMAEYRDNGARLGWLLDPQGRRVFIYRPGEPVDELVDPPLLSGDPVLPGFSLDVRALWRSMQQPR